MNLVQLHRELNARFPKVWIKEGSLFSNNHCESLWTGEGSEIEVVIAGGEDEAGNMIEGGEPFTVDAFDFYPMFESMYVCGVHKDLYAFLRERGYYAEAHDGGTFFIWQG